MNEIPRVHRLKLWPMYFALVASGVKRYEVRINDRDFQVDDIVRLEEWDPGSASYSGNYIVARITHVTSAADLQLLPVHIAVFGIKVFNVSLINDKGIRVEAQVPT